MKNIILMVREIAQGLSDEELAKDIAELESGKKKLPRLLSPYRRVVVAVIAENKRTEGRSVSRMATLHESLASVP